MKKYKFSITNDIVKNSIKVKENLQEAGMMMFAYNTALANFPGSYVHEIRYSYDKNTVEGGTHKWTIELKEPGEILK